MFVLIGLVALGAGGYLALQPDLAGPQTQPTMGTSASSGPVSIGEGEYRFLTGADGLPLASTCDPQVVITEKRCGDLKIVVIDAERMPYIARNISLAWAEGRPAVLHKEEDIGNAKRVQVCGVGAFTRRYVNGSCDEFPFASSREGGGPRDGVLGARTEEVHKSEQDCQGGTIRQAYVRHDVKENDEYVVIISHPDRIATQAWTGQPREATEC